jgi:hypothetical protein
MVFIGIMKETHEKGQEQTAGQQGRPGLTQYSQARGVM